MNMSINFKLKLTIILISTFLGGLCNAQINGYTFSQISSTYSAITGGTVIATATGASGATALDDVVYDIPSATIPFNFIFNNKLVTGCKVSTNGYITFGSTAPIANNIIPLSSTDAYEGAISALGSNLSAYFFSSIPAQTGEIRYQTIGVAPNRFFVVQWKNFNLWSSN